MYVTVWTAAGAIKVALPNDALIADLKELLVENLHYVPEKLEVSYGGRYVRDDVHVARFPPDTLVAEGPRYDPRRMQQLKLQRQREEELQMQRQREMAEQQRRQKQQELLLQQQRAAEAERRNNARSQQQYVDPISALFGLPSSGASPLRRPAGNQSVPPQSQQQQRGYREDDYDDDEDDEPSEQYEEEGGDDAYGLHPLFGGIFGAPRPQSRSAQQHAAHRAQQAQRQQQQEALRRKQQQQRKASQADREATLAKLEAQREALRQQQAAMRRQQEALAAEERVLLIKMEEEARKLREKEAADLKKKLAKEKAALVAKAKKAAAAEAEAARKQKAAAAAAVVSTPSKRRVASAVAESDDANATPSSSDDEGRDALKPLTREESAVIIPPHLQRVGLDETLHRPQDEQPSPATSGASTPRRGADDDNAAANGKQKEASAVANDDDDDVHHHNNNGAVTESPADDEASSASFANADHQHDRNALSPADDVYDEGADDSEGDDAEEDEPRPADTITVTANFPELGDKAVPIHVSPDALVSDVLAALRKAEPEATKSGVRIMFFEKYVRKESDCIRAVPLIDGSAIDVCTGRFLSENEMTLYLADRHLAGVQAAIKAHQGPIDRNMRGHWNEQLMKALMLLDSLQDVPEDIRLRRKAGVKRVMAEQDAIADMEV